jgi:TonB family protein
LADKTNGWIVFVKPKLLFGSLIVGLSVSACSLRDKPKCYVPIALVDTTTEDTNSVIKNSDSIASAFSETTATSPKDSFMPEVMCYDYHDNTNANTEQVVEDPDVIPVLEIITPVETEEEPIFCYVSVESMPTFPGGEKAMREFLQKELRYPIAASENRIEGKVFCRFTVKKDGTISNVEVVRSVDATLDREAVRVIESMPRWVPGQSGGQPISVKYTFPILFRLKE